MASLLRGFVISATLLACCARADEPPANLPAALKGRDVFLDKHPGGQGYELQLYQVRGEARVVQILRAASEVPGIRSLWLTDSPLTSKNTGLLAALPDLCEVHFAHTTIDDGVFAGLTAVDRLTQCDCTATQVTEACIQYVDQMPMLVDLDLSFTSVTGEGLGKLQPRFERLSLEGCDRVGDAACRGLSIHRSLEYLNLSMTSISDAGVGHLAALVNLRELSLSNTPLQGAALKDLQPLKGLQILDLSRTSPVPDHRQLAPDALQKQLARGQIDLSTLPRLPALVELRLVGAALDEASLARVVFQPALERLDLRQSSLTDADLLILAGCKTLKEVYLANTRVTEAGKERFVRQLGQPIEFLQPHQRMPPRPPAPPMPH